MEVVQTLLDKGSDANLKALYGWTPLIRAAFNGHAGVVRLLIDHGAEIEAKTNYGWTGLMLAALRGQTDTVKVLLDRGAEVHAKNRKGLTAADYAKAKGHKHIEELIGASDGYKGEQSASRLPETRTPVNGDPARGLRSRTPKTTEWLTDEILESSFNQKGTPVKFSYSWKYETERRVFRQAMHVEELEHVYRKSTAEASKKEPADANNDDSYKARIAIALVDLNHDGTGDILARLDFPLLCKGDCVYILLSDGNSGWKVQDEVFSPGVEILSGKHHGCNDLSTMTGGMGPTIEGESWAQKRTRISRFDGRTYKTSIERVWESDSAKGVDMVSTWIYGPPCPFRLLDIR